MCILNVTLHASATAEAETTLFVYIWAQIMGIFAQICIDYGHIFPSCCPNRFFPSMPCLISLSSFFLRVSRAIPFTSASAFLFCCLFRFLFCFVLQPQKHRIILTVILALRHTIIIGSCTILFHSILFVNNIKNTLISLPNLRTRALPLIYIFPWVLPTSIPLPPPEIVFIAFIVLLLFLFLVFHMQIVQFSLCLTFLKKVSDCTPFLRIKCQCNIVFVHFHRCIIIHCVHIHNIWTIFCLGHLGCGQNFAIINSSALNILVCDLWCTWTWTSLGRIYPGIRYWVIGNGNVQLHKLMPNCFSIF